MVYQTSTSSQLFGADATNHSTVRMTSRDERGSLPRARPMLCRLGNWLLLLWTVNAAEPQRKGAQKLSF